MDEYRENCPVRHDNGNCICVGGFCTAVPEEICKAVRSAYDDGFVKGARYAIQYKIVTCGECIHRHNPRRISCQGRPKNWFCADGVRRNNHD